MKEIERCICLLSENFIEYLSNRAEIMEKEITLSTSDG